jgi:hypothetical protein
VNLPALCTLFFEDLSVGMTETLVKVPSEKAAKGKRPMMRL